MNERQTGGEGEIVLRKVFEGDLPIFFEQQQDKAANYLAAFIYRDPYDRQAFNNHWHKIFVNPTVVNRTILYNGQVAGYLGKFEIEGQPEITYWLGKNYWGKGIATGALTEFMKELEERPIYARAAKDNFGSIRVLQKCGFQITGYDRGFANARGQEIEEAILQLG
ncbi:MAG: GNAT family N-acetyltransferase [Chloroflexi bacterium]|nr:GNAT family N-acetyltransferase [Chloroflexota bacterium]OJV90030.1 MAG: GNAT family N-acetyltransferase [Chloroflexi bacterium 54-19]